MRFKEGQEVYIQTPDSSLTIPAIFCRDINDVSVEVQTMLGCFEVRRDWVVVPPELNSPQIKAKTSVQQGKLEI